MFQPKAAAGAVAAARAAEAEEATKKADEARLVVFKASRVAAQAMVPVRVAENLKLRAEAQLEASERALASASSAEAREQAEDATAKAAALAIELSARLATAKAELQPKLDAVGPAREALVAAEAARAAASEEARKTARDLEPISVFITHRTQHLYVRQGFEPILDIPVTIRDPDRPTVPTFLPRSRTPEVISTCDGAWSRWLVDSRMPAWAMRMIPRAGIVLETWSRGPATWLVRKKRSTEFRSRGDTRSHR